MRVVIDSNRMKSDALRKFLCDSPGNRAVITDWVMIEAYKGPIPSSVHKSIEVLSNFPSQVIVLKNTGMCMKIDVSHQMANRFIWGVHTKTFNQFAQELQLAHQGYEAIKSSVDERVMLANKRINDIYNSSLNMFNSFPILLEYFDDHQIQEIKLNQQISSSTMKKIFGISMNFVEIFANEISNKNIHVDSRFLSRHFLFRFSLAHACHFINWIRGGHQLNLSKKKLINNYVDSMFCIFGSYFNGIMTGDANLLKFNQNFLGILKAFGGYSPHQYINN